MFQLKVRSYVIWDYRDYRNYYKGHMDKIKGEGGDGGREVGLAGVGWRDGEKRQTTVTE